jgi:Tol biopolymer transport system component
MSHRDWRLAVALLLGGCGTEPSPPPPPFVGRIVFSSNRADLNGPLQLFAMDTDGTDVQVVPLSLVGGQADINPDGDHIVLNVGFALYTVRGDGTDLRLIVPAGHGATKPAWSPDGQRLAYIALSSSVDDIWTVDPFGNQQVNLTATPDHSEFAPDWSPDGTMLVYDRYPVDLSTRAQLWTIKADGSDPQPLLADPENDLLNPVFSPDGTWIAYIRGPGYFTELRAVRADGTDDHAILQTDDNIAVDNPAWSPDGQSLVFSYGLNIATIHADGTGLRVLTDSAQNFDPDWGPAIQP